MERKETKTAEVISVENGIASIRLGKSGQIAKLDECSIPLVSGRSWRVMYNHLSRGSNGNAYAVSNRLKNSPQILMHRLIVGANTGEIVDHINGNGLDNRKCNLRIVSASENMQNIHKKTKISRSGFVGVQLNPKSKGRERFVAAIKICGRAKYLGSFDTPQEAHARYMEEKVKLLPKTV